MKKWIGAGLLVLVAGVAALEVSTYGARGWWAGEAFYRGRPKTYWSQQVSQWRPIFS